MREHLARIAGQRALFRAKFERFGNRTSHGYFIPTALFVDVRNVQGVEVCDHIWMRRGKQIEALSLQPGDTVQFMATAHHYWSGYADDRHLNHGLKFPTKLTKVLAQARVETLPLFSNQL